jgi:glycerophosphoryl diester phosphodiesterase
MRWILPLIIFNSFTGFSQHVELYGHRGWRARFPENSVLGFQEALKLPINGLEWDVVVNADSQLVLSHEPFFHPTLCCSERFSTGKHAENNNLFKLHQSEISDIPCGCKPHPDFPEQEPSPHSKPLLKEVLEKCTLEGKTVLFEIKSNAHDYGIFQPHPEEYANIILRETKSVDSSVALVFMSFDPNILNALHRLDQTRKKMLLVYKPLRKMKHVLAPLNFKPEGVACYHFMLNKKNIQRIHNEGLKCLAWTVNSEEKAKKLTKWNIDGLITDKPDAIYHVTQ